MSGHTETFIVFEERPLLPTFHTIREILTAEGIDLSTDDYILLNDTEEEEFDLVEIPLADEVAAMEKLLAHPGGGIVPFELEGSFFHVATTGLKDHFVHGISVWMFESEYAHKKERYDRVILEFHTRFEALRTIQGWNLMDYIDSEENEIGRVYEGIFVGSYDLDMRSAKIIPDTKKEI